MKKTALSILPGFVLALACHADPQLSSWFTADSGQYARLYESTAAETAGNASPIWSRGAGVQSNPTYAGVSEIVHSANWVYIRTTGLASHVMGPWYLNAAKTQNFPNFPANTATIYRLPRTPTIPATKTATGLGAIGRMVNGVAIFDSRDAFSYSNINATDATPGNGITGDGIWNRDGYHNEGVTFDPALAHQAGNNYHYHAQPIALRYQLGDHVDYNAATNRYTESAAAVAKHSPILGWAADGLPVYGPYGYASPLDAGSGLKRIVSGFVPRDGNDGTTNLNSTGRTTLPAWAQRLQNRPLLTADQTGPAVGASYALGHYIEDYEYLGDLGFVQGSAKFDLNEQNARYCVTPEFPAGTWAYYTTINAAGTPAFPYTTGRQYFGSPTGGAATIAEPVTTHFQGGPNKSETWGAGPINVVAGNTTLTWSAVEGGTYEVSATSDLTTSFTALTPTVIATDDAASATESGLSASDRQRFYKVRRTALATFDANGFNYTQGGGATAVAPGGSAARGSTVTVNITLPTTPPWPPAAMVPASITLAGTIAGTAISRPSQGTAQATFTIPAGAPTGPQNIVVVFAGPTYTLTGGFTIN